MPFGRRGLNYITERKLQLQLIVASYPICLLATIYHCNQVINLSNKGDDRDNLNAASRVPGD